MCIVLFSWETGSIVFEYGILTNSDVRIWADDRWWGLITIIMASNILDGS